MSENPFKPDADQDPGELDTADQNMGSGMAAGEPQHDVEGALGEADLDAAAPDEDAFTPQEADGSTPMPEEAAEPRDGF